MARVKSPSKITLQNTTEHSILRTCRIDHLVNSLNAPLPEETTERRLFGPIAFPGKANTVIGIRRAGKTTFLHQLRRNRLEQGIAQPRLPHLNFEDERLAGLTVNDFSTLIEEYYRRFPAFRSKETVTWCFDEIQMVPGWERFVRRLLDNEKVEVFLSGSSAAPLAREIATSLRGRAREVVIFPFIFEEYLRHHEYEVPERLDLIPATERSTLQGALRDCLICGGFPEAQGSDPESRYRLLLVRGGKGSALDTGKNFLKWEHIPNDRSPPLIGFF